MPSLKRRASRKRSHDDFCVAGGGGGGCTVTRPVRLVANLTVIKRKRRLRKRAYLSAEMESHHMSASWKRLVSKSLFSIDDAPCASSTQSCSPDAAASS